MNLPPLIQAFLAAPLKSIDNLKEAITDVKPAGFDEVYKHELISFKINAAPGFKPEIVGEYVGRLAGRNRDLCIGFGEQSDKAIAARVLIDGDANKIISAADGLLN